MMEWVALIPTRSNMLRVRFTGGTLSGYGVTPATFTTSNAAVAHLIEKSYYFKAGKILLLKREDKPAPSGSLASGEAEQGVTTATAESGVTPDPGVMPDPGPEEPLQPIKKPGR